MLRGHPRYVYEAGDFETASEILAYCNANHMPVTFCGSQTSMTGASVAEDGVVVAMAKKNRILDIVKDLKSGGGYVVTEPGVILGDLKCAVIKEGLYYPPDPTSYDEAQVGATVATNATGEDTFRFGPTRIYVEELDLIRANGKSQTLVRKNPPHFLESKNTAGYALDAEDIDKIIGSEGTLGLITRLKLKLLPLTKPNIFILILPFSSFENALDAVVKITTLSDKPRALELIGPGAGAYFKQAPHCPEELKKEEIFLYLKDDYGDENELHTKTQSWFDHLTGIYADLGDADAFERIFLAQTHKQLQDIRECRHYIPLKVNEEYFPFVEMGGGKVGTDWWVPLHHLKEMMIPTYREALNLKIPFLVFAHIGNGHPHWNFLTRNAKDKALAHDFVLRQCRQAVLFGGGVAGEHGLGKIKRDLLQIQHSPKTIRKMVELKTKWDPNWILGRGNILKPPMISSSRA